MLQQMQFSERTGWGPGENEWAAALRAERASDRELLDLTVSNPGACGLGPHPVLLAALADPRALRYVPDPLGMPAARSAVAGYYHDHGASVPVDRICLTASTSEGYSFLFRLLCDPGDEVLIARPSYPLFDLLARLDDVNLREYPLFYEPGSVDAGGWQMDLDALTAAITPRTRAVVAVHPNNPTGNYLRREERAALRALCAERGLALIVDEVFLDYALGAAEASFAAEPSPGLCFVLSGLSKVCALPQMKLSWMAVCGPEPFAAAAMERLEVIADTFLSVNAPVQLAAAGWLAARHEVQEAIRERMRANLGMLRDLTANTMATPLLCAGGWTAVLRVPATVAGEEFALAALRRGVVVQPGEFYGLPAGRCVLSLLTPPEVWARGVSRLPIHFGVRDGE